MAKKKYVVIRTLDPETKKYVPRSPVTTGDAVIMMGEEGEATTTLDKKLKTIKTSVTNATNSIQVINQQIESGSIGGGGGSGSSIEDMMSIHSSDKDEKGIFRVVEFRRPDSTKYMTSTLSAPNEAGKYTIATWQYFNTAGTEVTNTVKWTLGYDEGGDLISKTPQIVENPGIGG